MKNENDSIYAASVNGGSEINRGIEISLLGVDLAEISQGTFSGPPILAAWENWAEIYFQPIILPTFRATYEATAGMKHREITQLDHELDSALPDGIRQQSIAAALAFRGSKAEARHIPQWTRFEEKLHHADSPGHLATLFAIQSALFNVPIFSALISYAYVEWNGAKPADHLFFDEAITSLLPMIQASQTTGLCAI